MYINSLFTDLTNCARSGRMSDGAGCAHGDKEGFGRVAQIVASVQAVTEIVMIQESGNNDTNAALKSYQIASPLVP